MSESLKKVNMAEQNRTFESSTPQEILKWAIQTYKPRIALSSSFGAQSAVLLHMCTQIEPAIPILFIDTGFLFQETYEFADTLKKKLNLNIKMFRPSQEQINDVKEKLKNNDSSCCDPVKVDLMKKALVGLDAWIAGLRRDQAATRKNIKIIEDYGEGLVKVHPIANWTSKDVHAYMTKHNLPYHPLREKGYTSIGCEPCTRKPSDPNDERSGRWAGQEKTECGIHTFIQKKEQS